MNAYDTFVVMFEREGRRRAVDVFTDEREAKAQAEYLQRHALPDAVYTVWQATTLERVR